MTKWPNIPIQLLIPFTVPQETKDDIFISCRCQDRFVNLSVGLQIYAHDPFAFGASECLSTPYCGMLLLHIACKYKVTCGP
jgi:hypothetical protein